MKVRTHSLAFRVTTIVRRRRERVERFLLPIALGASRARARRRDRRRRFNSVARSDRTHDLIGDPRFDTAAARPKHEPEVDAMIAARTRQHDKREAMPVLGGAGVSAGAIFDTMELTEEADFEGRASCRPWSTRSPARSR